MADIISTTILVLCGIAIIAGLGVVTLDVLSKHSKFFLKIYLYIFEHEDYKVYKELKTILKNGGNIPVYSSFANTKEINGYYFMVFDDKEVSLWKDGKPIFVAFHKFIIDELIKLDNAQEAIEITWNYDNAYRKQLNERIAQLEKEIAERKAKLAELKGE